MSLIVLLAWLTTFKFNLFNVVFPHEYTVHNAPNAAYPQQNYNMNPAGIHPNGGQAPIINNYYGAPGIQSGISGGGGGGGSGPSLLVNYRIQIFCLYKKHPHSLPQIMNSVEFVSVAIIIVGFASFVYFTGHSSGSWRWKHSWKRTIWSIETRFGS